MDPKEAQKARAAKYGIAVKAGGNVTKPGKYSSVPDDDFGDPVNYRYPLDAAHIHAALSYWGKPANREEYSAEEQKKIGSRIDAAAKEHDVQVANVKAAGDMTFSDIRDNVRDAIGSAEPGYDCYIQDMYPDSVVYCSRGRDGTEKLYKRSYSMVDGNAALGDPNEVERNVSYDPISAAGTVVAAAEGDDTGSVWRMRILAYGPDKQGRVNWDKDACVAALPLFEGAKVFALTDSQHRTGGSKFGKSPRELVGAITKPEAGPDAIYGNMVILPSASWLQKDLVACRERGIPPVYGVSVDVSSTTKTTTVAGKQMTTPVRIGSVQVDVVYDPIAKGEFLQQLAAAAEAGQKGDTEMFEKLMAALKLKRPELHAQILAGMSAGSITEDQALEQIAAAATVPGQTLDQATLVAALKDVLGDVSGQQTNEVKLLACSLNLDKALLAARLPEKMEAHVRKQFAGKVFEETELQEQIKAAKELCDELTGSGNVQGMGSVRVGVEPTERLQAACDKMFDLKVPDAVQDVDAFTGLRAAYVALTGDTEVRGYVDDPAQLRQLRAASFDSSTFQFVLGNTLYRRMITDYNELGDMGVNMLVGQNIRNARDFRSLQSVRIAYYGNLPNVDPENNQDYPDLGTLSDEQVDYTLGQKGGIITISRKMIINDDIRAVDTIRRRLPRAARRTLAQTVWGLLINNATYLGDNNPLFCTAHNNLVSVAFGQTPVQTMKTQLYNQAEPQSGAVLAIRLKSLAIPEALWGAATSLNQTQNFLVSSSQVGNPFYHYFGPNNENIFENPFITDPNIYFGLCDAGDCEIVELAFLNGQQEPEMFVADNPNFGQFFVGDRIQYKIRHEYNCVLTDFRGVQACML